LEDINHPLLPPWLRESDSLTLCHDDYSLSLSSSLLFSSFTVLSLVNLISNAKNLLFQAFWEQMRVQLLKLLVCLSLSFAWCFRDTVFLKEKQKHQQFISWSTLFLTRKKYASHFALENTSRCDRVIAKTD